MNKSLFGTTASAERQEQARAPDACSSDPALFWPAVGYGILACIAGSGRSFAHLPSLCKMDTTRIQPH